MKQLQFLQKRKILFIEMIDFPKSKAKKYKSKAKKYKTIYSKIKQKNSEKLSLLKVLLIFLKFWNISIWLFSNNSNEKLY